MITKLQTELTEKDMNNVIVEKKISDLNTGMKSVEISVKEEIEKTLQNQNENHKAISSQISGLSDQFKTLQSNLKSN